MSKGKAPSWKAPQVAQAGVLRAEAALAQARREIDRLNHLQGTAVEVAAGWKERADEAGHWRPCQETELRAALRVALAPHDQNTHERLRKLAQL